MKHVQKAHANIPLPSPKPLPKSKVFSTFPFPLVGTHFWPTLSRSMAESILSVTFTSILSCWSNMACEPTSKLYPTLLRVTLLLRTIILSFFRLSRNQLSAAETCDSNHLITIEGHRKELLLKLLWAYSSSFTLYSRVHATPQSALSVLLSIGLSICLYVCQTLFFYSFDVYLYHCPCLFWATVPKGSMTYAFTHMGNFLLLLLLLLLLLRPPTSNPCLWVQIPVSRPKSQS